MTPIRGLNLAAPVSFNVGGKRVTPKPLGSFLIGVVIGGAILFPTASARAGGVFFRLLVPLTFVEGATFSIGEELAKELHLIDIHEFLLGNESLFLTVEDIQRPTYESYRVLAADALAGQGYRFKGWKRDP